MESHKYRMRRMKRDRDDKNKQENTNVANASSLALCEEWHINLSCGSWSQFLYKSISHWVRWNSVQLPMANIWSTVPLLIMKQINNSQAKRFGSSSQLMNMVVNWDDFAPRLHRDRGFPTLDFSCPLCISSPSFSFVPFIINCNIAFSWILLYFSNLLNTRGWLGEC